MFPAVLLYSTLLLMFPPENMLKFPVFLVCIYLVYGLFMYVTQRGLIFPGIGYKPQSNSYERFQDHIERIWFDIKGGKVEAWFMKAETAPDNAPLPLVIFAHGNGEYIDDWPNNLLQYNKMGIHILLIEYPGYGRSEP